MFATACGAPDQISSTEQATFGTDGGVTTATAPTAPTDTADAGTLDASCTDPVAALAPITVAVIHPMFQTWCRLQSTNHYNQCVLDGTWPGTIFGDEIVQYEAHDDLTDDMCACLRERDNNFCEEIDAAIIQDILEAIFEYYVCGEYFVDLLTDLLTNDEDICPDLDDFDPLAIECPDEEYPPYTPNPDAVRTTLWEYLLSQAIGRPGVDIDGEANACECRESETHPAGWGDTACQGGEFCVVGRCVECRSDADCGQGQTCNAEFTCQ